MSLFQALFLGAIQGVTEFFPISSSGHLVFLPIVFGWDTQPLVFDTVLHLGTALALVVFFWKDLVVISKAFAGDLVSRKADYKSYSDFGKMGVFIVVGSVPAGVLGLLLNTFVEDNLRTVVSVISFLVFGSVLMFVAERFSRESVRILTVKKGFIIGLFQALALFPGISRSGSTISAGMLSGLSREEAARFSFLLSVPIVVSAAVFKVFESFNLLVLQSNLAVLVGFVSSFVVGSAAIKFLLGFLSRNSLYSFIVYRLLLVVILVLLVGF